MISILDHFVNQKTPFTLSPSTEFHTGWSQIDWSGEALGKDLGGAREEEKRWCLSNREDFKPLRLRP